MSRGVPTDQPVPAALASAEVLDEHKATLRLGSLWKERGAVLAFTRHFG